MVLFQFDLRNLAVWLLALERALASRSGCTGGYCFIMADSESHTQEEAQRWCQNNGSQLAEILNKDIQDAFTNFILQSSLYQSILGWFIFTNGLRSLGNWIWLNGDNIGSISILEQRDASFRYAYLRSNGAQFDIYAARPIDAKGFICSGVSDCSGGVMLNGKCYKSYTEMLSWYDARNRCLDIGGDLAIFDFITTDDGVHSLNGSWISSSYNYWIGIKREWWTWIGSNTDVKFSSWETGYPSSTKEGNNACLCLHIGDSTQPGLKWRQCGCNQRLSFLCVSGNSTSPTSSTLSTSLRTPLSSTMKSSTSANVTYGTNEKTSSYSASNSSTHLDSLKVVPSNQQQIAQQIGIAVGLGVGLPLLLIIGILLVINIRLRRQLANGELPSSKIPKLYDNNSDMPMDEDPQSKGITRTDGPYESLRTQTTEPQDQQSSYEQLRSPPVNTEYETSHSCFA